MSVMSALLGTSGGAMSVMSALLGTSGGAMSVMSALLGTSGGAMSVMSALLVNCGLHLVERHAERAGGGDAGAIEARCSGCRAGGWGVAIDRLLRRESDSEQEQR